MERSYSKGGTPLGFYFRKSIGFGPLRVNFSKSGISTSIGVRGARISAGPRGTFVNLGMGGLYYRQKLSPSSRDSRRSHSNQPHRQLRDDPETHEWISTAQSQDGLAGEINSRAHLPRYAPWILVAAIVMTVFLANTFHSPFLSAVSLFVGLILSGWAQSADAKRQGTDLVYGLDEMESERFKVARRACSILQNAQRVWVSLDEVITDDWKRNAGANQLINRQRASIGTISLPFIKANISIEGITAKNLKIAFMPDSLFVYDGKNYATIPYDELRFEACPISFGETETVPSDTEVIGHTWQFVNRDGGRDRRFKENRQIPKVVYGQIDLAGHKTSRYRLLVSNAAVLTVLMTYLAEIVELTKQARLSNPTETTQMLAARLQMNTPEKQSISSSGHSHRPVVTIVPPPTAPTPSVANRAQIDWKDTSTGIDLQCGSCGRAVLFTVGDVLESRSVKCWRCGATVDTSALRPTSAKVPITPPSSPPMPPDADSRFAPINGRTSTPRTKIALHRIQFDWFCGSCGSRNVKGDNPCHRCETRGSNRATGACESCGFELPTDAKYCQACGKLPGAR